MNEKLFQSTKLVTLTGIDTLRHMCFLKTWDAFMTGSNAEWFRVFRDGTKTKFGAFPWLSTYFMIGRVGGFPAYWNGPTLKFHPAFEVTGTPDVNIVLNPDWVPTTLQSPSSFDVGAFIDDFRQVYLYQPNFNSVYILSLEDGTKVGEIVHNCGEYFQSITWVQEGQVAGMCRVSGKVVLLDYLCSEPEVSAIGEIDPFVLGAYDCSYKLFVTIGADKKVRVYSGDLMPSILSSPVFHPPTVSGMSTNEVKVRLTGQEDEPIPNWWVSWALEGVGGGEIIGRLDKYTSLTDPNGYATTLYIGPDDATTGQCKIKASVVI